MAADAKADDTSADRTATLTEADVLAMVDEVLAAHPPATTSRPDFLGARFDAGLGWVHFPVGLGGLGLPVQLQRPVDARFAAAGAPDGRMVNTTAYGQGAATIVAYGTPEQKQRYLRPIFTCEEIWCQLFSEPGAGSDLASLATRAVKDGDEWIVNGEKVWTTRGHLARFGLLLARTDPDVEKHTGLTYFVLDMAQPGVEVRPLRQMTGDSSFNQVFMRDARIPDHERLGDVGQGWAVSHTTLMSERVGIAGGIGRGPANPMDNALGLWRQREDKTSAAALALKARMMHVWADAEVNRLTSARAVAMQQAGKAGPEGSIGKLAGAVLGARMAEITLDLLGPYGMLFGDYDEKGAAPTSQRSFVGSPSGSLAGGTNDIQRNIIGDRVLGLPREPAADKGIPWSKTLRS
ncbi:MAG TPA: acyl-CoA dehydrogenase family protein [Acidimicrobiales bacterium]